ncbi:16S rRNA (cytidine(1402)-2'-O)-methyltransferase [Marinobacter changyiensis]|uniref:16S rRNA (cytidine(1402)-2'-O)-methyltransferase n=1 Tax=Marinobacter changyiensis TaxID=2604091 RepID=UPI001FE6F1B1|nr:16S rRNA (cytidine(1402)-2'-O)-methyltransferase [Marinobacter changyiensis]
MASDSSRVRQTGVLYIVATPIGNLDDLSARAIETLKKVDVVAAEDTRHSRRLLQHLGLQKTMLALHDHNERERTDSVLDLLEKGRSIALVSDAGTPLISDPGYVLVREARLRGLVVTPIPGACALIAALSAAGLPTDRFRFEGFLPAKRGARRAALEALKHEVATLVFYESPHRILETAAEIAAAFGAEREVVFGRELTKAFETFYAGAAGEVSGQLTVDPFAVKGEFVVMVHGATQAPEEGVNLDVDLLLRLLTAELPVKKAARMAAELTGLSKNALYQRALEIKEV